MSLEGWIGQIAQGARQIEQGGNADAHADLARIFSEAEAYIREQIQATTSADIQRAIQTLRTNRALIPQELALIKLWVVGDATAYSHLEHNVEDWKLEIKRLVDAIHGLNLPNGTLEPEKAFRLKALLTMGVRVLWDLHHYLEGQERLVRFTEATGELDREKRDILIDILIDKLRSPDF